MDGSSDLAATTGFSRPFSSATERMKPGQIVSHYQIVERLGQGGMGVVYLARDTALDRTVAIKCLPTDMALDDEAKERFTREAKAASALDHANICTIHEIAETDEGELYIVMAHYRGRTLEERAADERFTVARTVDIGRQLARALERAHEAGIVHRDLKPANVMITDRGEVKLLDFGIAKLASGRTLTQTGAIMGSSGYLSPEQIDGRGVDHRTDLWSLGVILYQMLSGERPFTGDVEPAVMFAIINKDPVPLDQVRDDVPPELARLIDRCLAKDPAARVQTAAELVAALDAVGTGAPSPPVAGGAGLRRKRPRGLLVGIGLGVALAVAAALAVGSRSGNTAALPDSVVAVVPFTVRGAPEFAYLEEGMVDLMSAKLAGGFTTVNPRWVMAHLSERDLDPADPGVAEAVARTMGAGRYVTGQIIEVGGRITLTASLYDSDAADTPVSQASVDGPADALFDLIDRAVAELLTGSGTEPSTRLQSMAAATSASLAATRSFLEGERLLRGGEYRAAAEAYDRAVELDSAFALAHYRKSVAADWIDAYDVRSSADRAMAYADQLSPRDRSLLEALRLRRHGLNAEAEQAYRAHLHRYPDEVEALVQLGEVLFHDNPRRGRSMLESVEPFQRALDLEPANLIAHIHLARTLALLDSTERLRETADYLARVAQESERALEVEALYAYSVNDSSRKAAVMDRLKEKAWFYRWYAVHGVARFVRDLDGADALLAARTSDEPLLYALVPAHLIMRGRHDDFRAFMAGLEERRNPSWDLYEAYVLTSGTYDASREELETVLSRLQTATPGGLMASSWLPPYEDMSERALAFERDYFIAQLLLRLDREADAVAIIEDLAAAEPFPGMTSFRDDPVHTLRAEVALHRGDRLGALAELRQIQFEIPHAAAVRAMTEGSRARFLRAELEQELGDRNVARMYYRGLDEAWSPWDSYFLPMVFERLGHMAEEDGRTEDAIGYYSQLIDLWQDADPDLLALRQDLEARREALLPD